jgi:hypothetical protein
MMNHVKFRPFVGPRYQHGCQGKKILILDESHYTNGQPGWDSITNDVVARLLAYHQGQGRRESWMNAFTKMAKIFKNGKMTAQEVVDFWESIMYYTFVQEPMSGPHVTPSAEQFKNSEAAFAEVVAYYQPDLVIVWGGRLWKNVPKLENIEMIYIPHPLASSYNYEEMSQKLQSYIDVLDVAIKKDIEEALDSSIESLQNVIQYIIQTDGSKNHSSSLVKILSVLSIKDNLAKLFNKLSSDEGMLMSVLERSYYHQNGFDKFTLINGGGGFKLRLHVWKPENITRAQENIHDHRWSFASKILYGSFSTQTFNVRKKTGEHERYFSMYHPNPSEDRYHLTPYGRERLELSQDVEHKSPLLYHLPYDILHRISAINPDLGCITLMITGPADSDQCRLFSEREISEEDQHYTRFEKSYIKSMFNYVIDRI